MSPERWLKIEALFESTVDLRPAERAQFLSKECSDDVELKREVEKLLQSSDSADDFIESPIWTDSSFLNTSAKKEISESLDDGLDTGREDNYIGQTIGVYRLTKEIGRGGMGAVYLAERADGEFQQTVAIKLIKRGMDSDFIIRRFRHERQILASFEHPFIARLLDGGTTSEGVPYFVMEYIPGETLYKYCDSSALDVRARLKVFQKVCSAIEYAHEKKIIHRDIKPSNILINQSRSPKLLDFGIAKILDPNLIHESLNPTASMFRMMTPDYASPEQVKGIEVTTSSDIYSLGVLLYELLTGHRPYNFTGRALHEVSQVVCEVSPEPPSRIISKDDDLLPQYEGSDNFLDSRSTTMEALANELAGNIDDIVMKAISKNPSDRYSSVRELSKDISRHLNGAKIEAPRFSPKRNVATDAFPRPAENSRAMAVLPFKFLTLGAADDTDDRFLGVGLADALITRLSKIRRFVVRPTSSILGFGDDLIDPIRAGRDLNVDYILDGSIKKAGNRLRVTVQLLKVFDNAAIWATSIDETLADVLTLEDTLANKVIEVLLPQLTGSELEAFSKRGTENPEAFEHYLRGRFHFNTFTEDGFAKAFLSFHRAIAADPEYAHAYSGLADYYNWLGIIGVLPPQYCFQPAIDAATKAVELDDALSEAHASLGFSLHAGNYDWSRAEFHLKRAIDLNPSNANAYVWYSMVLFTQARFTEGLEIAQRAVDLDPLTPFNHHNVGWGLYYARKYDEAIDRYRKVVGDFPKYSFGYYGLSKIHRKIGDTRLAITENDRAKELMGDSVFSLLSEAECYAADGQIETAESKIADLQVMSADRYVSPYQLALAYQYLDRPEKVLEFLEKAAEIKEAWLNWMGIEPVFDPIRTDPRFQAILEKNGYQIFANNFAASSTELPTRTAPPDVDDEVDSKIYDLTTLMIDDGEPTDGGIVETPARRLFLLYYVAAAALLMALIAGSYYFLRSDDDVKPSMIVHSNGFQNPTILITPFKEPPGSEGIGIGVADSLTNKLGYIKSLQVISANTGRQVGAADPMQLRSDLGVAFIIRGDLSYTADQSVLNAELVNAGDNSTIWSETFSSPKGDLFGLERQVSEKILSALAIKQLPLEQQQLYRSYTTSSSAYQLYLVGRSLMANRSRENLRKAIAAFERSLAEDRGFALAYVGLADTNALLNLYDISPPADAYPKAKENALKALSIDENLAEAHASLAYVKFYYDRDREGAELEFRRAIQLNPSYAPAHHWFALALTAMNRPVEALSEAQISQRLDPRSPSIKAATAIVYFMDRKYREAIDECDKALALDQGFVPALKVKRWVYTVTGDGEGAKAAFEKELSYSGGTTADPGWKIVAAQLPSSDEGRKTMAAELNKAVQSDLLQKNDYAFAFEIALAYLAVGDRSQAMDWLERSESARGHSMNFLSVDPRLARLSEEPRFRKLLGRGGG
ncbi:MAG: protein kinase [Acidobacteriota bacterium]